MRSAKRSLLGQSRNRSVEGLEASELECLLVIERGKQARDLAREQALSGAGRPLQQQRVPAGGSQDRSLTGMLLAADLVELRGGCWAEFAVRWLRWNGKSVASKRMHPLAQRGGGDHAYPREELCFRKVGGRDAQHGAGCTSSACGKQNAARRRAKLTCEIEFGDGEQGRAWRRDLVTGDEQGGGQGEVNGKAALGKLRGYEIEEHPRLGKVEAAVFEGRRQAFFGFARSEIGEADQLHARQAAADETLDAKGGGAGGMETGSRNAHVQMTVRSAVGYMAMKSCCPE